VGDGIFPAYDLAQQAAVQQAAAAGVPVAEPSRYEPDPGFLGAPFVAMPFVDGAITDQLTPADPWLTGLDGDDDRHRVWTAFLDTVASIDQVDGDGLGLRGGLAAELEWWDRYLGWATDGHPPAALAEALAWCRANRPPHEPPAGLLWGDVRLGNVIWDEGARTPKAVLDWDMATVGPAEMDLAWFLALEQVGADLTGMSVPGFGSHGDAVERFEQGIGRPLQNLPWFEVFALVRASAVSTRIAVLFGRAGQRSMFQPGDDPTLHAALERIERIERQG
jgi:aminoglycoside phosphotransferase (APT) family kinase protein